MLVFFCLKRSERVKEFFGNMIKSKYKDVADDLMENNILTENEYNQIYDLPIKKENKRKEKLIFIRKCLFRGLFPLALYGCHVAGKDYMIHEETNAYNSYAMINYLGNDTNNDGIDEINTWILNYVNDYFKPTENKYYANSNLFYDLCDETRVSDNIFCMIAMDILDYDIIEIDGVKYSRAGNVSEIHYTECLESQRSGVISSSIIFENDEQIQEYLKEKPDKKI